MCPFCVATRAGISATMRQLPLSPDEQRAIISRELAKLIVELLIRNDQMSPNERNWKISYYPCRLSSIRAFKIVGHANPEVPEFARKWNEAIALLKSRAFIMLDPSQDDREDFVLPTSLASEENLAKELGVA
jgi:hypothetical protein